MLITLDEFKKQNDPCFVAWTRGTVTANDKNYDIFFRKINGEMVPYIEIAEPVLETKTEKGVRRVIEFDADKNNKIRTIVTNKRLIKNKSYMMRNNKYRIIGIGPEAIQAYKNESDEWKYFRYETQEGEDLLNKLLNVVEQMA